MNKKPTYEELEERIKNLEDETRQLGNIEKALRESEEKYRSLIERAQDGIVVVNQGKLELVNPYLANLLGHTVEEMEGRHFREFIPPEISQTIAENYEKRLSGEALPQFYESKLLHKDGGGIDIEYNVGIVNYRGLPSNLTIIRDITERKNAEKALKISEAKFRSLFDQSLVPIAMTRIEDGVFMEVNDAFLKLHGFKAEEVVGKKSSETGFFSDLEDRNKMKELLLRDGCIHSIEMDWPHKAGGRISCLFWGNRITLEGKDYVLGGTIDISERKKAVAALRESEEKYRALFESSIDAIFLIDFDKKEFLGCNPAAKKLFAIQSREQLAGLVPQGLSPEYQPDGSLSLEKSETMVAQAIQNGSSYFEWTFKRLTGEEFTGAVLLTRLKMGCQPVLQATVRDITEQKRTQELIIQTEKMMSVGGLAAGMAHEINNPLAGIIQNIQVLRNRIADTIPKNREIAGKCGTTIEAIEEYMKQRGFPKILDAVMESGRRASKIVNNMLSFSRNNEVHPVKAAHNLPELLDATIELASSDYDLKQKYDFREIKLVREYDPFLSTVICEESKIQQVFLNILRNGAQAMASVKNAQSGNAPEFKKPCFFLRIKKERDMACIEIEDNGPGMDEATRKKAFEPFFTTKEAGQGTGLGLSVSYFIITETHKGSISVESAPGKGAKFIIRLPAVP